MNNEFEVLETFLEKLPNVMKKGGRIAILTFHSEKPAGKKIFPAFLQGRDLQRNRKGCNPYFRM